MTEETFWGLTATAWTAIMALLTAGLLAVAMVAVLYAAKQVKLARQQSEETRRAEAEASRPYVIVTVEPSLTGPPLFDLVAKNIGLRPAVNVTIAVDPPPVRAEEIDGHEMAKIKLLNEPVAMIAPGQEMRIFYDNHRDRMRRDDLPTSHTVNLEYRDSSGHNYVETSVLDVDAMKGVVYTSVKTLHDIGKSLAEIQKTLKYASVLGRSGAVDVQASIEPRTEQQERLAQERAESAERHAHLIRMLRPEGDGGQTAG